MEQTEMGQPDITDYDHLEMHYEDPCLMKKSTSEINLNSDLENPKTVEVNDCEVLADMMAKLQKAYNLISEPKRRVPLYSPKDTEIAYLNKTIFPTLLPAISRTLQLAKLMNSLQHQLRTFNGIDTIVEYLWNNNPKHPLREQRRLFSIPFVKKHLKEHPRKPFPKSMFFTDDEAACVIQSAIKGFLVRAKPDVQEMRQFWKRIKLERLKQEKEDSRRNEQVPRESLRGSILRRSVVVIPQH